MAKIPNITDHANKIKATSEYYNEDWECKYCKKVVKVFHAEMGGLRRHLRQNHRMFYNPYVIEEEKEIGFSMSLLLA